MSPDRDEARSGTPFYYALLRGDWLPPGVPWDPTNPEHVAFLRTIPRPWLAPLHWSADPPDLLWDSRIARYVGWYYDPRQPSHGAFYRNAVGGEAEAVPYITPGDGVDRGWRYGVPLDPRDWTVGIADAQTGPTKEERERGGVITWGGHPPARSDVEAPPGRETGEPASDGGYAYTLADPSWTPPGLPYDPTNPQHARVPRPRTAPVPDLFWREGPVNTYVGWYVVPGDPSHGAWYTQNEYEGGRDGGSVLYEPIITPLFGPDRGRVQGVPKDLRNWSLGLVANGKRYPPAAAAPGDAGDPTTSNPYAFTLADPSWRPPGVPYDASNPQHARVSRPAGGREPPDLFWYDMEGSLSDAIGPVYAYVGWYVVPGEPWRGAHYHGGRDVWRTVAPIITPASGPDRGRVKGTPRVLTDWSWGLMTGAGETYPSNAADPPFPPGEPDTGGPRRDTGGFAFTLADPSWAPPGVPYDRTNPRHERVHRPLTAPFPPDLFLFDASSVMRDENDAPVHDLVGWYIVPGDPSHGAWYTASEDQGGREGGMRLAEPLITPMFGPDRGRVKGRPRNLRDWSRGLITMDGTSYPPGVVLDEDTGANPYAWTMVDPNWRPRVVSAATEQEKRACGLKPSADAWWFEIPGGSEIGRYLHPAEAWRGATLFDGVRILPWITPADGPDRNKLVGKPVDPFDWSKGIERAPADADAGPGQDANTDTGSPEHANVVPMPAPALLTLLAQINARWPRRSRWADGILADAAHQQRSSDHNAGNALDITYDAVNGPPLEALAGALLRDRRTHLVIYNGQIANVETEGGRWQPYTGLLPHTDHLHVSIYPGMRRDASAWDLSDAASGEPAVSEPNTPNGSSDPLLPLVTDTGSVTSHGWTPPSTFPSTSVDPRVVKAPTTYQGNPPPPDGWRYWPVGKKITPAAKRLADLGPKSEPGTFIQAIVDGELIGMRSEWHPATVLFDRRTGRTYEKPGLYHAGSLMVPIAQPASALGAPGLDVRDPMMLTSTVNPTDPPVSSSEPLEAVLVDGGDGDDRGDDSNTGSLDGVLGDLAGGLAKLGVPALDRVAADLFARPRPAAAAPRGQTRPRPPADRGGPPPHPAEVPPPGFAREITSTVNPGDVVHWWRPDDLTSASPRLEPLQPVLVQGDNDTGKAPAARARLGRRLFDPLTRLPLPPPDPNVKPPDWSRLGEDATQVMLLNNRWDQMSETLRDKPGAGLAVYWPVAAPSTGLRPGDRPEAPALYGRSISDAPSAPGPGLSPEGDAGDPLWLPRLQPGAAVPLGSQPGIRGSAFMASLPAGEDGASRTLRAKAVLDAVRAGVALPIQWKMVVTQSGGHTACFFMGTDTLRFGVEGPNDNPLDWDWVRVAVDATTAQQIADVLGVLMPTARLCDLAYQQADVKLEPHVQSPVRATTRAMLEHHAAIEADRARYIARVRAELGDDAAESARWGLADTIGKFWILAPELWPKGRPTHPLGVSGAVNYGWHTQRRPGRGGPYEWPVGGRHAVVLWQQPGHRHNRWHVDYSQWVPRFVHATCIVDGETRPTAEVYTSPELCPLVSINGPMGGYRMPNVPLPDPSDALDDFASA